MSPLTQALSDLLKLQTGLPRLKQDHTHNQQPESEREDGEALAPAVDNVKFMGAGNLLRNQPLFSGSQVDEFVVSVEGQDLSIKSSTRTATPQTDQMAI